MALSSSKEKVEKLAMEVASLKNLEEEAQKTAMAVGQEVAQLKAYVVDLETSLEASRKEAAAAKEELSLQKAKVQTTCTLTLRLCPLIEPFFLLIPNL